MNKGFIVVLMVLALGLGGCAGLSFGQVGDVFTKLGATLQGECEDVPTNEIKDCLAALKEKALPADETLEDEVVE